MSDFGYTMLGFGSGGSGPVTLVYDTFTDTNDTLIASHTPDINTPGNPWVDVGTGSARIINNQFDASTSTPGSYNMATIDCGTADCVIYATVTPYAAGAASGVHMRISAFWQNSWNIEVMDSASVVTLWELVGGSGNSRATAAYNPVNGVPCDIVCTLYDENISFTAEGAEASYGSAANFKTITKHGISTTDTSGWCDDFKVTTL